MTKIIINGVERDMTSEEETQLTADRKILADAKKIRDDERTAKKNNKTSGKAKLKAGEALTDAEISALFGD